MNARWYAVSIGMGFLFGLLFFAGRMFDWLAKFVMGL